jgi:hypothetical protein
MAMEILSISRRRARAAPNVDPGRARGRPVHGYDIAREIARKSGGLLTFHVASLYPLLYKLEDRGWISGRWVEKAGQRGAAITVSPQRANECWRHSADAGRHSWRR